MDTQLLNSAKHAALAARKAGAKDTRVKVSRSREVRFEWRDGRLERIRDFTKQGLSISLFVDGRYSGYSTSDLRHDAIASYVTDTVAATRHLAVDEHRHLPDPSRYKGMHTEDLQLKDSGVSAITPEERLAVAKRLEDAARSGPGTDKIISVSANVRDFDVKSVCFCSNGFEAARESTNVSRSVSVSVKDTGDRKPASWAYGSARYSEDLPPEEKLGAEAVKRALDQCGSKQVPTGRYEVVIENRTVPRVAWRIISPLFGGSVQQKRSYLEDKLGKKVWPALLSITDDPHLTRGLSTRTYDGEGMATKSRKVIDKGVISTFFLDTYYASKFGVEPTTGGVSNLVWSKGKRDARGMIARMKEGLFVTSFLGGNSNATTGDFSFGIKGYYVKSGKIVHPVSEMNIAGNHLEFWNGLVEVGADAWRYSSNMSPSLRFKGVQCSGA